MSKASEWAKIAPKELEAVKGEGLLRMRTTCSPDGEGFTVRDSDGREIAMTAVEGLALAGWILDTFGEPKVEGCWCTDVRYIGGRSVWAMEADGRLIETPWEFREFEDGTTVRMPTGEQKRKFGFAWCFDPQTLRLYVHEESKANYLLWRKLMTPGSPPNA